MVPGFQKLLSSFLLEYLPCVRGFSSNTVIAYRDAFVVLLRYLKEERCVALESISFNYMDRETVEGFLLWLGGPRGLSTSTCNQRLAAVKSFLRYAAYAAPELSDLVVSVLAIDKKKAGQKEVAYISVEAIAAIMDAAAKAGTRQLALVALLYDSGARVQEICDLRIGDFRASRPYTVSVVGKGRKARVIPLTPQVAKIVVRYLAKRGKDLGADAPMFVNRDGKAIGRAGIAYILKSFVDSVRVTRPDLLPASVTPHVLRHSKAVHLLENGVDLIYIRDFLGHSSVTTTEVYAKTSPELKRQALMDANSKIVPSSIYDKTTKRDLLDWLKESF
jgi:site-specific recombinase XerD